MESFERLELADWRRQTFDLYRRVRDSSVPGEAWRLWRNTRNHLFRTHDQSPLPAAARDSFTGVDYFEYDPGYRITAEVRDLPPKRYDIETSGEETMSFTRFGGVDLEIKGRSTTLELYWLEGYGGGIFLPFKDSTNGSETYGGGRYLLDTVKGADLGSEAGQLVLDFNFAYNPSCSYDPQWVCPLSPPENRLEVRIEAGERYP
jgi:uncharacterized protein (DUF1684 family)